MPWISSEKEGGEVTEKQIRIKIQHPDAPPLEVSFPEVVFDHRISIFEMQPGKQGQLADCQCKPWGKKMRSHNRSLVEKPAMSWC